MSIDKNILWLQKSALMFSLPGMSSTPELVFLYCHGPTEHAVVPVGSILQVLQGFVIGLECESLARQIQLEVPNQHTTARHSFSMVGYLDSDRPNFLLA